MNKRIKKSMNEIEQDKRETGLQTSIDSSNKVRNDLLHFIGCPPPIHLKKSIKLISVTKVIGICFSETN